MKKTLKKIERVGLVANVDKLLCRATVRRAAELISRSGRRFLCESATADFTHLHTNAGRSLAQLAKECDLIMVFGGDGTMLRASRCLAGSPTPILGINVGQLGFLTAVPSGRLQPSFEKVWNGEYSVESRPLIEAVMPGPGKPAVQPALNDIVISRGAASRMIELDVSVDGVELTRYRCDGLIISSPSGSTAYSLAAGGAIVSPDANVFTLTPICPHTLSNRSVIVSLDSVVRVTVASHKPETILAADGAVEMSLHALDTVTIRRSRHQIRLVHLNGDSFFQTLRHKLNWTGSHT